MEVLNNAPEKILIVDDVESNRFVLRDIISSMGYQPILAENGEQALKLVERLWPALIISDVAMPVMDGHELCQLMKKDDRMCNIPIIFISAFDDPKDIVKGFELGGEDYITKPFIPEVVKARVGLRLKFVETTKELVEANRLLKVSINEQLYQLELEKKKVLYALLRVARENAAYDRNHMERLSYNSRILSEAMQLSPDFSQLISDTFIDTIEMVAPLCDLGNIAVPSEILQKKGKLTDEERKCVEQHTELGAKMLADLQNDGDYNDFLQMSYDIAYYHHENWDGTGYPCGKCNETIPISAQIVSVVADYCALTEARVYREAYDNAHAIELMEEVSGKKYNPQIFTILKMIVNQFH